MHTANFKSRVHYLYKEENQCMAVIGNRQAASGNRLPWFRVWGLDGSRVQTAFSAKATIFFGRSSCQAFELLDEMCGIVIAQALSNLGDSHIRRAQKQLGLIELGVYAIPRKAHARNFMKNSAQVSRGISEFTGKRFE